MGQRGPRAKGGQFKSAVFSMRMRPELRSALEAAANESGKSLADEIQDRLALTLTQEERTIAECGGRRPYAIFRLIVGVFWQVGMQAYFQKHMRVAKPDEWLADPYAYDEAVKCAVRILERFRPSGKIKRPRRSGLGGAVDQAMANLGASYAEGALFGVLQAETDLPLSINASPELRKIIADDLGPMLRRRIGPPIPDSGLRSKRKDSPK